MDNKLSVLLKRYNHDDFPKQSQEYPGLHSKMARAPAGDMAYYEGCGFIKELHTFVPGCAPGTVGSVAIGCVT